MKRRELLRGCGIGLASAIGVTGVTAGAPEEEPVDGSDGGGGGSSDSGGSSGCGGPAWPLGSDLRSKFVDRGHIAGGSMGIVSTHGMYDITVGWDGTSDVELKGDLERDDYRAGAVDYDAEELTVYVHGWNVEVSGALAQARDNSYVLRYAGQGWDHTDSDKEYVCFQWDSSDKPYPPYFDETVDLGQKSGHALAQFVADYRCRSGTDPTVRLIGHSMGSHVVCTALRELDDRGITIDNAAVLAGSVDPDDVACGTGYGRGIAQGCESFDNYRNRGDDVLTDNIFDRNIGESGLPGDAPANAEGHDVSDLIDESSIVDIDDLELNGLDGHNYYAHSEVLAIVTEEWTADDGGGGCNYGGGGSGGGGGGDGDDPGGIRVQ